MPLYLILNPIRMWGTIREQNTVEQGGAESLRGPTPTQVNAQGYSEKFMRRRREWKGGHGWWIGARLLTTLQTTFACVLGCRGDSALLLAGEQSLRICDYQTLAFPAVLVDDLQLPLVRFVQRLGHLYL